MPWLPGQALPSGSELAEYLASTFEYEDGPPSDLLRVSQYAAIMSGSGPLYEELRRLFNADYAPTPVHGLLARIPSLLRDRGYTPSYQLIVTTNYDDALERAFAEADEPVDLVTYVADGPNRGRFLHRPPDAEIRLIEQPNVYQDLSLERRTVILKIHGAIDRTDADLDSYVITEDHYIDYLTHTDVSTWVPVTLAAKLHRSHFLFLGYSLHDWNLRVILHRIWGDQRLSWASWAVQRSPLPIERQYWAKRDVEILTVRLEEYIAQLEAELLSLQRTESEE
ncbi:MAG: SIR2 family NAD-dependent protein deacylase [Actinomycetota bacterium]